MDELQRQAFGQAIGQLYHALPHGQEPGSHLGRIATQMGQALGGLHRQFGHVALRVFQRCPDLHQLRGVVCRLDEFNGQSAHDALSRTRREGPVLAQQTSGVQRFTGLSCLACGLEANAQCQSATGRPLWQRSEALQGCVGVPVVQAPAGGANLGSLTQFLVLPVALGGGLFQGVLQVAFARGPVLQGMGGFGRNQMRQRAQLLAMGYRLASGLQCTFLRQRSQR